MSAEALALQVIAENTTYPIWTRIHILRGGLLYAPITQSAILPERIPSKSGHGAAGSKEAQKGAGGLAEGREEK